MGYILILILTTIVVYQFGEKIISIPDTIHVSFWRWGRDYWLTLGTIVAIILIAITSGGMVSPLSWISASVSVVLGILFALTLIVSQPDGHYRPHLIKHKKSAH